MKILLTGFGPFGTIKTNPSQLVVEQMARGPRRLPGWEIITRVLPTEYDAAGNTVLQLIREHRPDKIICLGVAAVAESIRLERIALNIDDAALADNAGLAPRGRPIAPGGPLAYASTLALEKMERELSARGIPVAISNHAGTYVCNHVFYVARHEVEISGLDSACGFIHLPDLPGTGQATAGRRSLISLEKMVEAIECCLKS